MIARTIMVMAVALMLGAAEPAFQPIVLKPTEPAPAIPTEPAPANPVEDPPDECGDDEQAEAMEDDLAVCPADAPADLAATIFHCLGIGPDREFHDATARPYRVYRGKPIEALF